ncbi:hypothetical protein JCM11641_005330 [Rhodosporidiobolus odoratus]
MAEPRSSISSHRSQSSNIVSDSRRPSQNSQYDHTPSSSRQQSFSSADGTAQPVADGPASAAASGSGLIFPGPNQGSRPTMSPRQSHDAEEEQERLSGPASPGMQQRDYPASFPGPPTRDPPRDPAQHPLPSSRQQSVDSSAGDGPVFSSPFPPPSSSQPSLPSPQTQSRSHLAPSLSSNNLAQLQPGQSSSASGGVEPSPDPSTTSSYAAESDYIPAGSSSQGDFSRSGDGLGLGRGFLEQTQRKGLETRRPSLATVGAGGPSFDTFSSPSAAGHGEQEDAIPTGFDEGVLRALCDMDCGMPLLLERMKQGMASCREASVFLKKRAQIEEDYARAMSKLAKSSIDEYGRGEGKAGSFVTSWLSLLRTHELLGDNRQKFATQLSEMSDELSQLGKEVEKTRKTTRELGTRLERALLDQEGLVEKARGRFDSAAEELERLLMLKQGESFTPSSLPHAGLSSSNNPSKGRSFGKAMSKLKGPKNPAQVAKAEEEVRMRMGQSSDAYRAQVQGAQTVRQDYFQTQLPRILRSLKESVDEVDLGTQYHLSRYAYLFESLLVTDGLTISPVSVEDGPGIKSVVDVIDVREDFKLFMQQFVLNWQVSGQRGPRRDGPADEGFPSRPSLSPRASHSNLAAISSAYSPANTPAAPTRPTFGVDLGEQMARDGVEVPRVLEKCAEAIELHGLDSMGIYRLSGTTSRVQRLKAALDRDIDGTDLLSEEHLSDINDIAAVCKLWFRELPEPLLTWELYHQFIDVSKIENDRLRHIRLHERVNELPDPNYATLKFLMGHLDKIAQQESVNQMSVSNLAIVFGPNLLGAPPPHLAAHYLPPPSSSDGTDGAPAGGGGLADMQWQSRCIETILRHYQEIFVE